MISIALAIVKRFWPFILAGLLMVVAVIWWNRFIGKVEQRGYDKAVAEYAVKLAEAKEQAAKEAATMIAAKDAAIEKGVQREKDLRRLVADGAAIRSRLYADLANLRIRNFGESHQACIDTGNALATVFEECVAEYGALGEKADRHASDSKTLSEAWPK